MPDENVIVLKDPDTGQEIRLNKVNPLKRYMFCPQCELIRGGEKTLLTGWEEAYFNSWGMCKTCFEHINDHKENFTEFSGQIKMNDEGNFEIVRDKEKI